MDMAQIQNTMIFRGMTEEEISSALSHLQAEEKRYEKGQVLLHAGSVTEKMGLVLEGSVTVESNDVWGNRTPTPFCRRSLCWWMLQPMKIPECSI